MKKILSVFLFLTTLVSPLVFADPPSSGTLVINTANAYTANLQFLSYPGNTDRRDIVNNTSPTAQGGALWTGVGASGGGSTALVSTGGSGGASWPFPPGFANSASHDWTVFVRANITSIPGTYHPLFSVSRLVDNSGAPFSIGMTTNGGSTAPASFLTSAPSFQQFNSGDNAFFILGSYHTYAMAKSGQFLRFYQDGAQWGSTIDMGSDFGIGWGTHNPIVLLTGSANSCCWGNGLPASSDVYVVWSSALDSTALTSITADPYQLVAPAFNISGALGVNGANARVTMTGTASATTRADASGNYSFNTLLAGTYNIVPSKVGVTFSPTSRSVTISTTDQTANFTATVIPSGTIKLSVVTKSPTSAEVLIQNADNVPCVLNLFEGNSISDTAHADANNVTDTSRSDTRTVAAGRRVRIGHDYARNAMTEGTTYTLNTVCGSFGQANLTFITPHPPSTATQAPPLPYSSTAPFGYDFPSFDPTILDSFALPFSGIKAEIPQGPFDRRFESIALQEGISYCKNGNACAHNGGGGMLGATGWTINDTSFFGLDAPSSYSSTSNTNPIILFPFNSGAGDTDRHNTGFNWTLENIGLQIWGSGTNATDINRTIYACITRDFVNCDPNPDSDHTIPYITIVLPLTTNKANPPTLATISPSTTIRSKVANFPWPAEYPAPNFKGWNTYIRQDELDVHKIHIAGISAGRVVGGGGYDSGYFPVNAKYIHIPGISAASCPNDICAIESVTNSADMQLSDHTITSGDIPCDTNNESGCATAVIYGIKIWKATATGTINLASRYTRTGRSGQSAFTAGVAHCSNIPVTRNGHKGNNCFWTFNNFTQNAIWIADERNIKPVYLSSLSYIVPNSFPNIANGNDHLRTDRNFPTQGAFWDSTNGNAFWIFEKTVGGQYAFFKGTLGAGACPPQSPTESAIYAQTGSGDTNYCAGNILWENMMPSGGSPAMDIASQISRSWPSWNQYKDNWGHMDDFGFGSSFSLVGMSGNLAILKGFARQDSYPCFSAVVDILQTPAKVVRFFSTMSDSDSLQEVNGGIPQSRWGTCHGVFPDALFPNTVNISVNATGAAGKGNNGMTGNPSEFKPRNILMGNGTWSSDGVVALSWPPQAASGTDASKPKSSYTGPSYSALPQVVKDHNYAPNQFVRMRIYGSGDAVNKGYMCTNSSPDTTSLLSACGWSTGGGGKSAYYKNWNLLPGDRFTWYAPGNFCGPGNNNDCEILMVAEIHSITDAYVEMTVMRDAAWIYACLGPFEVQIDGTSPGHTVKVNNSCGDSASQLSLPNGWMANMVPGWNGGKEFVHKFQFNQDGSAQHIMEVDGADVPGHGTEAIGIDGTSALVAFGRSFTGLTSTLLESINNLHIVGNVPTTLLAGRSYAGIGSSSLAQGYLNASGYRTDGAYRGSATDDNRFASGGGGTDFPPRTITTVGGMNNVYKYPLTGNYKTSTLYIWSGNHIFKDMSGPACNMATGADYTMCYNYRSGITSGVAGSVPGDLFLKDPHANPNQTICYASTNWNCPMAVFLGPGDGGLRQFSWWGEDPEGRFNRIIGPLAPPGFAVGFSESNLSAFGNKLFTHSGGPLNNYGNMPLILHLPETDGTYVRNMGRFNMPSHKSGSYWNANLNITVPAIPGYSYAYALFGYDLSFHCQSGQESCQTDDSYTAYDNPYAWTGEASHATPCASGCILHPAVLNGRFGYYKVRYTQNADGSGRNYDLPIESFAVN